MNSFYHNNKLVVVEYDNYNNKFEGKYDDGSYVFYIIFSFLGQGIKIYDFKSHIEKQGVGTKVLSMFEDWAKEQNQKFIEGEITESPYHSNPKYLEKFYKKRGYKILPSFDDNAYAEILKKL